MSLENDILRYKTEESNHTMERENDKRRIDELTEENYVLQMSTKSSFSESHSIRAEMQVLKEKRGNTLEMYITFYETCRPMSFSLESVGGILQLVWHEAVIYSTGLSKFSTLYNIFYEILCPNQKVSSEGNAATLVHQLGYLLLLRSDPLFRFLICPLLSPRFPAGQDTNILTEQIDKDVTRIHKLELENARLLSELEDLKVNGFKESSARILELEKANKKQEMSARQSENLRVKDSESITSLEKALTKAETNVKRLENVVATMREEESQLRIEKDTEVDNLTKQVDSMRQRQEQGHNEQIADLDKENTRLVKVRKRGVFVPSKT